MPVGQPPFGRTALFQRHLGRMMGYAIIFGNGFSFICLGLGGSSMDAFLPLFIPHLLGLALWALSISNLQVFTPSLVISDIHSSGKAWSWSFLGLILSGFSLAGMPLLASFPLHQSIWLALSRVSLPSVIWLFVGWGGLLIAMLRILATVLSSSASAPWGSNETLLQRFFIAFAVVALFILGIFPSWLTALWQQLPVLFEHIGK